MSKKETDEDIDYSKKYEADSCKTTERMTDKEEEEIRKKQVQEIYSMLEKQNEKLGINSVSEIQEQLKFYM